MKLIFKTAIITIIAIIFFSSYISAQNERNFHIPVDTSKYNLSGYPAGDSQFNIPYGFETNFEITNGKYFYLQFEDVIGDTECNIDVYFYTPNGKQISKQHIKYLNSSYNIAQNGESITSSILKVKILNNGKVNRSFKMIVAVPKDVINAVPQVIEQSETI
jgi:hypothetical protein